MYVKFFSYGEKHRDIGYRDAHSYSIIPKEIRSQIEKREKEEAKEAKDRLKEELALARARAFSPPRARYNPYKRPWPYGEPLAYSPQAPPQQPVYQPPVRYPFSCDLIMYIFTPTWWELILQSHGYLLRKGSFKIAVLLSAISCIHTHSKLMNSCLSL